MRVFLVLCILAVSRADHLHDILQRHAVTSDHIEDIAKSIHRRSFLDTLKNGFEKFGQEVANIAQKALPVVEQVGKDLLPTLEKVAPSLISAGLTALVGKRDVHRRNIFDDIKKGLETVTNAITTAAKAALPVVEEIGKQVLPVAEKVAPSLISAGLTALVGKRDVHFRDQRSFLDDLKKTLETLGQQALKAVETLAPTVIESALPALLSSVGKRDHVEAGLLGHVRDEMLSVVDKLKESVEGAEKIATNLESNLKTAAQGLTSGQDVKALAQLVLSTLEADVKSMIDKGTFDVDIDSLIKNIVPNAFAKLFSKNSRRSLLNLADVHSLLSGTAFGDLSTFLRNIESAAVQSLSPALSKLKALAQTFLTHAGQATAQVAAEAVKFFQPFQAQLGSVFTQIENVAAKLTGH